MRLGNCRCRDTHPAWTSPPPLAGYMNYYKKVRLHSSIGYLTPQDKLVGREKTILRNAIRSWRLPEKGRKPNGAKPEKRPLQRPAQSLQQPGFDLHPAAYLERARFQFRPRQKPRRLTFSHRALNSQQTSAESSRRAAVLPPVNSCPDTTSTYLSRVGGGQLLFAPLLFQRLLGQE